MSNPIALPEIFKQGFQDFIIPELVDAPNTTIQNRAKVSNSLKAIAGMERVSFSNGIIPLMNEFGPNGEPVFELSKKDARFRFVGVTQVTGGADGSYVLVGVGGYAEVTFFGTGLNILVYQSTTVRDFRVSVDGGAEGSNILISSATPIVGRNYGANIIVPVASGLTLGWHTVKLRNAHASSTPILFGVEIVNNRLNVAVAPGRAIAQGSSQGLALLSTSSFNEDVLGVKGARVVKYIENGELKTAIREVDSTSQFLTLVDHSNEEILRRSNFREYGVNRGDDLSTLSGSASNRAFTLDDGTTTINGFQIQESVAGNGLRFNGVSGDFFTYTFVGTGLDIIRKDTAASGSFLTNVLVDGVLVGSISALGHTNFAQFKVASGLPYGTHTVKFLLTGSPAAVMQISEFIVYQPKKPVVPDGVFEVADYNLMANFVANTTSGLETISTGCLRKQISQREGTFINGTGGTADWTLNLDVTQQVGGWQVTTNRQNGYIEFTFFGTGFDLRFHASSTRSANISVLLNGLAATTANFPSLVSSVYGTGVTFAAGVLDQNNASAIFGCGFVVSGLPLGSYTVKFNNNTASSYLVCDCIDIITPIHINEPSLRIGSQSLRSNQNTDVLKQIVNLGPNLKKAKALLVYDTTNLKIIFSENISGVLASGTGAGYIFFEKQFKRDDYVAIGSANGGTSKIVSFTTKRSNSILFANTADTGAAENNIVSCLFFGELIDE